MPRRRSVCAALLAGGVVLLAACGGGHPAQPAPGRTTAPRPPTTAEVPALFNPSSVSFVSATIGYALGVSTCTVTGSTLCIGLARTTDAGVHWTAATPPPFLDLTDPLSVPILRFADARTGFATDGRAGTGLLVTRDGGSTWQHLVGIPATAAVTSVLVGAGHVLVVAGDEQERRIYVGAVSRGSLTPVGPALVGTSGIVDAALTDGHAYVVSSPGLGQQPVSAYRSVGLTSWTRIATPCGPDATGRVAASGDRLVVGCQAEPRGTAATKRIYVSTDAGVAFTAAAGLSPDDYLVGLAVGSPKVLTAAASADTDELLFSADAGSTFTVSYASAVNGEGQGLHDLAYVDREHAFVVLGSSGSYAQALASGVRNTPGPRLLASSDGGAHWVQIQIRP